MSRSKDCISSPESPAPFNSASVNPDVCVFRHIALLHVPVGWRAWMLHFGHALFYWSMETFGIANEEQDTQAITARRLVAIGQDLEVAGNQLASLGEEPDGSEMGRIEEGMCDLAGELAPSVLDLAAKLRKAGT